MNNRDPTKRRKRKGDQNVFEEIMAGNFSNIKKETTRYRTHRGSQARQTSKDLHQDIS